jgi:membrane protease YdiL (CAAX protease family)
LTSSTDSGFLADRQSRSNGVAVLAAAVGPVLCAVLYAMGAASGPMPMMALLALAALLFGAIRAPGHWAAACFALAGLVFLVLAAGMVPGFSRLPVGGLSINTPKALAGLAALAMFPSLWAWNRRCTFISLACLVMVPLLALAVGFVHWAPSAKSALLAFAVANAFTVVGEEWFFRHWIQRPLARWGVAVSVLGSAVLFGLVHLGGGMAFAGLATLAGLAYAGVYVASGGSIWAAAALHWALNLLRVALFGM